VGVLLQVLYLEQEARLLLVYQLLVEEETKLNLLEHMLLLKMYLLAKKQMLL
jgi:hypothetical protein